ncbi:MAG: SapC family protein [Pseudomonadota bacterium]
MSTLIPISRETHAHKFWRRPPNYGFASDQALVPLSGTEVSSAAMALPLAFVVQDGLYVPVAVLGVEQGVSLYVSDDGRWLGRYIPASLRGYPFRLAQSQDKQMVLCFDSSSGLMTDEPSGEPIFGDDGQASAGVNDLMQFLKQIEGARGMTMSACAALAKHSCIVPWKFAIKVDGVERTVDGLFQIDESALNALPDDAFVELRHASALPLAYCQLLSTRHISELTGLAEQKKVTHTPPLSSSSGVDLSFFSMGDTLILGGYE